MVNENHVKKFGIGFAAVWLLSFLLSLGVLGVVIWAIVRVVLHFT